MKTIRVLRIEGETFSAEIQADARVVASGMCYGDDGAKIPVIWIEGGVSSPFVRRNFRCFRTGDNIPDTMSHFASIYFAKNRMLHLYVDCEPIVLPVSLN